jgi:hypothetical protein
MRFATYQGEQNLTRLVRRLFKIAGPGARTLAQQAEAALRQANPHLRDLTAVSAGTLIVVPEVADINPAAETLPVEAAVGEIVEEARRALVGFRSGLDASATRLAHEANETLKFLESDELKTLAEQVSEVKPYLPQITAAANARLKKAEALQAFQAQELSQLDNDLLDLVKRLNH